jgi:2OG-Fe(II) oxygenase superfamily
MKRATTPVVGLLGLWLQLEAYGHVVTRDTRSVRSFSWARFASSAKKGSKSTNQPRSAAVQRGFGAGSSRSKISSLETNDYAIFPALEPRVQETLVAAACTADSENNGSLLSEFADPARSLPLEVYQRLDQIYGFPLFNYETVTPTTLEAPQSSFSMMDLLTAPIDELANVDPPATNGASMAKDLSRLPPFKKIRVLHMDPLVLAIDEFFTLDECDRYVAASDPTFNKNILQSRSPTVGKDSAAKSQRTSTTYYHMYQQVPELLAKATRLLGIDTVDRWEEPQTVRYRRNEKFTWHLDALGPKEQQESSAGQRVATLLVYLTDVPPHHGGATLFRDLGGVGSGGNGYLRVQPVKGTGLLFFPAAGGISDCPYDIRTLHSGEAVAADAEEDKWIAQLWLRQRTYAPTAPPGNLHVHASSAVASFCHHIG